MAKRPLRTPALPAGDRMTFFRWMQNVVVDSGDLSVKDIGAAVGRNHQAIYKALTGPKMPSEDMTRRLARHLSADPKAEEQAMRLWEAGVKEQRWAGTNPTSATTRAALGAAAEQPRATGPSTVLADGEALHDYDVTYLDLVTPGGFDWRSVHLTDPPPDKHGLDYHVDTFAAALKAAVQKYYPSIREAAHDSGVSKSTVHNWVTGGVKIPSADRFQRFLDVIAPHSFDDAANLYQLWANAQYERRWWRGD